MVLCPRQKVLQKRKLLYIHINVIGDDVFKQNLTSMYTIGGWKLPSL
jgi:hypothetical protein